MTDGYETVNRIEQDAGIGNGLPPAFQYRPIDIGVDVDENDAQSGRNTQPTTSPPAQRSAPPATPPSTPQPADWDDDLWKDAMKSGGKYIRVGDGESVIVKFMSNDPVVSLNKFNRKTWSFDVRNCDDEAKVLSITNVGLMSTLYRLLPLLYKTIVITRTGVGAATTYTAQVCVPQE